MSRIMSTSALRSTIVHACGWNANLTPCSSVRLPTSFRFFARILPFALLRFSGPGRRPRLALSAVTPNRRELGICAVAVERRLQSGRIEILPTARHRRDADPRLVETFLKTSGGWVRYFCSSLPQGSIPWKPNFAAILMPISGCGFNGVNMWLLIAQRNLSPGSAWSSAPTRHQGRRRSQCR